MSALALTLPAVTAFGQITVRVQASRVGGGSLSTAPAAGGSIGNPEVDPAMSDDDSDTPDGVVALNRTIATTTGNGPTVNGRGKAKSNPELLLSFDGLNHYDQRTANGGNQFTVEPPDQGVCAGNGYVIESVNDVLRISMPTGTP